MIKNKAIKAPVDLLRQLESKFPNMSYSARLRIIFKDHQEMELLRTKLINPTGKFLWGKRAWRNRFEKVR